MTTTHEKHLQTLVSLAALITSSLDAGEVRRRAVEAAAALVEAEAGSLFLVDEASGELFFEVALGERGDEVRQVRLRRGEGFAGWVAEHNQPLLVADTGADPRFYRTADQVSGFTTRNVACVPVRAKGRVIGVLQALNKGYGEFTTADLEILAPLADQVGIALENARLYADNASHLQALAAQERRHRLEKERLVRDLHDGLGGLASNISLLAEIARRQEDPAQVRVTLATIADLSREVLGELRGFMNTLDSRELTWQALAAELRSHAAAMVAPHGIELAVNIELAEPEGELGLFFFLSLLRIAKESLANAVRHSGARRVELALAQTPVRCTQVVADDGCGLPVSPRPGRGLRSMARRAEELGGDLAVQSPPGTRITLTVPLPFVYPDREEVS